MNHETNTPYFADDSLNPWYLILAASCFVLEVLSFFFKNGIAIFWLVHGVICLFLTFLVFYSLKKRWDMRIPVLLWLSITIFGPFGSLGMTIFFLFYAIFKRLSTPFEKWYISLFPDLQLSQASKIYQRIIAGWDDYKTQREVISFQDLMQVGTVDQKQTALEIIAQNFNPLLAPILKMALDDANNQVRVQAASIISKIDRDFEERKKKLIKLLESDPTNPGHILALAELLDSYAFAGILDFFREKENRELAIDYYRKYIDIRPDDHKAWMALGRLLNRINAFDQVMEWFEERMKQKVEIPASGYVWYWEALYMLHSFNKLSESAHDTYRKLLKTNPQKELLECVQLWASRK